MNTGSRTPTALKETIAHLRCPICEHPLCLAETSAVCPHGHRFDVARQGYLNLQVGGPHPRTGDSTSMVLARERFLGSGHYAPMTEALQDVAGVLEVPASGLVVDLAGGTGHHLGRILDARPGHSGICVDLSAPALRRAARTHPRVAAVGADAWSPLPLVTGCASLVVSIFGPRNPDQIRRILAPNGLFLAVTPTTRHLEQLIEPLGMLTVTPGKTRQLRIDMAGTDLLGTRTCTFTMALPHSAVGDLVAMGPTARHVPPDVLSERIRHLHDPVEVTAAVNLSIYRRGRP